MVEKNSAMAKGVCRHWSSATLAAIAAGAVGVAGNTAASSSWYLRRFRGPERQRGASGWHDGQGRHVPKASLALPDPAPCAPLPPAHQ
jgi:hypothetical protein